MKLIYIITFCIFTTSLCFAQKEHLVPAKKFNDYEGSLKKYYSNVFPKLYKGFSNKSSVRYTSMPSFSPEYAFSVEEKDEKLVLISNSLSENYWYAKYKWQVGLVSNEIEITKDLFDDINVLFQLLIKQTKKDENVIIGLDGIYYYFTIIDKNGEKKMGEIWSPGEGSYMGRLAKLCDDLYWLGAGEQIEIKEIKSEIALIINY